MTCKSQTQTRIIPIGSAPFNLMQLVSSWARNHRNRKALRKMSPQHLDDVGIDRLTAFRESRKYFWQ